MPKKRQRRTPKNGRKERPMKRQRKKLMIKQNVTQKKEQRRERKKRKLTNLKWKKICSATKDERRRPSQKKSPLRRNRKPTGKRRLWRQVGSTCLVGKTCSEANIHLRVESRS